VRHDVGEIESLLARFFGRGCDAGITEKLPVVVAADNKYDQFEDSSSSLTTHLEMDILSRFSFSDEIYGDVYTAS
jgi:hypothetical protein